MKKIMFTLCAIITVILITEAFSSRRSTRNEGRYFRTPALEKNFMGKLKNLEEQIDDLTKRVEELEIKFNPTLVLKHEGLAQRIVWPLKIDQVIYFDDEDNLKVLQVIDEKNIIAELRFRKISGNTWYLVEETVWISNIDTSGFVDDKVYKLSSDKLFLIKKTKTYETAIGGSKTIIEIEQLPKF